MKKRFAVMGMLVTTSLALFTSPASSFAQARVGQLGNGRPFQERSGLSSWIAQANWSTYQGANGRYEVQFPQQPRRQSATMSINPGNIDVTTTMLIHEDPGNNVVLMSASTPFSSPPGMTVNPELRLDHGRNIMVASMNATIHQEDRITVQGRPARSLVISTPNQLRFQYVLIVDADNAMFYQLIVGGPTVEHLNSPAARRFFNSFNIR
ncbi:hypothetical protein [Sodalinema gerasimenkoae]|uniref:hypothetical protein n=1 Tax=Sodalinema gerasimenkoae TaxID=2862348 RepID=UPI001359BC18|nr:hypothetical protein [Sodalinema gerasimenkoae]